MREEKDLALLGLENLRALFGDRVKSEHELAKYTSTRVGGPAEYFLVVESSEELLMATQTAFRHAIPYFVLGGGSNILISDYGISGLVIQNRARSVTFRNTGYSVICTADSGANISSLARQCISKGLGGLEWAIGVPGTVGGAVVGNSGAHGDDMNSNLITATIYEPGRGMRMLGKNDMEYEYRHSVLKAEHGEKKPRRVVLSAELELIPDDPRVLSARADAFNTHRKDTQPAGATMGSVFKNPEGYYAGYLIEAAGLKGLRIGGAHVSHKHANFFLNDDDAMAEDIRDLIAEAWNTVYEQFQVRMETEIEFVGDWYFEENDENEQLEMSNEQRRE